MIVAGYDKLMVFGPPNAPAPKTNRSRQRTGRLSGPVANADGKLLSSSRTNTYESIMPETEDLQAVERLSEAYRSIADEIAKRIVGQREVIEQLLIALFARGHCLLVGVPGLAKTLMIRTLADALSLEFNRVQFTPDLMPADITGTEVIQEDKLSGTRAFRFLPGPLFANIVLADEINRTPPKTQAALLEAMQEQQVTVGGQRHALPDPFFVLATQNPIEQEGTYPLPEAQLDRFLFMVLVDYPNEDEELEIVKRTTADVATQLTSSPFGEGHHRTVANRAAGAGGRSSGPLRDSIRPADARGLRRRAADGPRLRELGRRSAGEPIFDSGGQGAGGAAWPLLRERRRYPRRGAARAAPSHRHELQRRSGRA